MPLSAYSELDSFKVYACDCGLLRRLARIPAEVVLDGNSGYTEFKGAIQRRPPQLPVSAGRMDSEIAGALLIITRFIRCLNFSAIFIKTAVIFRQFDYICSSET